MRENGEPGEELALKKPALRGAQGVLLPPAASGMVKVALDTLALLFWSVTERVTVYCFSVV